MKKRLVSLGLLIACCLLLTSCQTLLDMLNPKASPTQIADIMAKAKKVQFKSTEKLWKSSKKNLKLKQGQWVTTLSRYKDSSGDVVLTTTKVINVSGNTVVLETERYSAVNGGVREVSQMTLENYPVQTQIGYLQKDYDTIYKNIRVARIINKQGDDPANEVPQHVLAMSQNLGSTITPSPIRTGDLSKSNYSSDYIKSSRCYTYDFQVSAMGMTTSGTVTAHSKIPINGLVKMDSDLVTEETIAFGTSGAVSAL